MKNELATVEKHERNSRDGKWLEQVVQRVGPAICGWGIEKVWTWRGWPQRKEYFPRSRGTDDGIDLVGLGDDGRWIAIQCKARGGTRGKLGQLVQGDVRNFIAAAAAEFWNERWIVTDAAAGPHVQEKMLTLAGEGRAIRHVLIGEHIAHEIASREKAEDDPRNAMQKDAVDATLRGLNKVRATKAKRHLTWREGESRATVVMPCGTGKTRVAYEVSRRMKANQLTVVLAPSIGLVRQLRLAWLEWAKRYGEKLAPLAVCSDKSVASPRQRAEREQERAALDDGERWHQNLIDEELELVGSNEITGDIEGKCAGITRWFEKRDGQPARQVVFCTYHSGHELAEAMRNTRRTADLLVCDEAHRTSGIRKARGVREGKAIRRFTLCHDSEAFPARNRVYMTATPKVFEIGEARKLKLEVNSMNDESVFGPWAFRLTYREAVERGLLTDYRIVAVALPAQAHATANRNAEETRKRVEGEGEAGTDRRFSASLALHKLAYGLALGGGIPDPSGEGTIAIRSSIAFCNRIGHSEDLAAELGTEEMQEKIAALLGREGEPIRFGIVHRDAGSNAAEREKATRKLGQGTETAPFAVTNVGIFGEGIDTPTLDAVAFIEPKRSETETAQAVGRPMRLSPDKKMGYVIVGLAIPPGAHAEAWLESRTNLEGWHELGAVLKALQRHDGRIEHKLGSVLHLVAPKEAEESEHLVVMKEDTGPPKAVLWTGTTGGVENAIATGPGSIQERLERMGSVKAVTEETRVQEPPCATYAVDGRSRREVRVMPVDTSWKAEASGYAVTPAADQTKQALRDEMKGRGRPRMRVARGRTKKRRPESRTQHALRLVHRVEEEGVQAEAIRLNVLERSGLLGGAERDFNVLRETVEGAAATLREDGLEETLKDQLEMTRLKEQGNSAADACTVAALMLTTAAIMHARLEQGTALTGQGIRRLAEVGAESEPAETLLTAWNRVLDTDYKPVFSIARDILVRITRQARRTAGLDAAMRGIVRDAMEIAESYAEMGMDHAGELFNKVMGHQAADGAYFTRAVPAMMLAELAVEASGETDWCNPETWERMTAFDPTCGSGTLLVAS